jgi:hypothetical protein
MTTATLIQQAAGRGVPSIRAVTRTSVGVEPLGALTAIGIARLPTDPVGSSTLTLTNVVVGSRYRVERQSDGVLVAEGTAAATSVALSLGYFAAGNSANDVRIRVRKGTSAPKYQPFQTQTTLGAANQSVYIAQVPDTIA